MALGKWYMYNDTFFCFFVSKNPNRLSLKSDGKSPQLQLTDACEIVLSIRKSYPGRSRSLKAGTMPDNQEDMWVRKTKLGSQYSIGTSRALGLKP